MGHVMHVGGRRKICIKIMFGKFNRLFGRPRSRWEYNIKVHL
jgi:hypothetical protein